MVHQRCRSPVERQKRILDIISSVETIENDHEAQATFELLEGYIKRLLRFEIINPKEADKFNSRISAARERRRKKKESHYKKEGA